MSRENVDLARRLIEAANRRDFEAIAEGMDPLIEWNDERVGILKKQGLREVLRPLFCTIAINLQTDLSRTSSLSAAERHISISKRSRSRLQDCSWLNWSQPIA